MKIKQYNGKHQADFYIQCKGLHSGRPLRNPIPNCFSIFTEQQNAFELAYAAYVSKSYNQFISGSVIPFIRISDCKKVLSAFINILDENVEGNLKKIEQIDKRIKNVEDQIRLLHQMKIAIARKLRQ
jgi:hypothetical protein